MRLDLSSKLWITIILTIVVGSIFNYWFTLFLYEHLYVEQTEKYLIDKGEKIVELYHSGLTTEELKETIEIASKVTNAEVIFSENPVDLCSCIPMIESPNNFLLNHEQRLQLLQGETVIIVGEHKLFNRDVIAVVVPILQEGTSGELIGGVLLSRPLATVTEAVYEIKYLLIIYILVFLGLGTVVGKLITNTMTKPLKEMQIAAKKMMDGDFDAKIHVLTNDEIGNLGDTLNHLSDSLKLTIELLSKEKKQLSQILDGIHDSVITINKSDDFVLCNGPSKQLLRRLNLNKDKFISLPEIKSFIDKVKSERRIVKGEIELEKKIFEIYLAPLIEDEQLWGTVIVIHDITHERIKEKEAREFLAIASHELRTPLSYVRGYTEALLDGVADTKDVQKRYLATIHNETSRMERVVNDLLDLAQLERSTYAITKEKIRLDQIINQVVERYRPDFEKKGVSLYSLGKEPLWMIGDEDRIIQILVNLLDNALRYTPPNGSVTIKTDQNEEDIIIQVLDTGVGISKEDLEKLGEMFFRVDKSRSRDHGGTGLGLAIVKQIIEKLNGRLEVESELGKGTIFTIYFQNQK